jgi:hypothetical protein
LFGSSNFLKAYPEEMEVIRASYADTSSAPCSCSLFVWKRRKRNEFIRRKKEK